ncbi:MAG: hypothetical protein KME22_15475 [Hassallia sp. WJT32-NPBG1]|nr:hypothetical protein [Hassallia sp. WJT32-NPBG1]
MGNSLELWLYLFSLQPFVLSDRTTQPEWHRYLPLPRTQPKPFVRCLIWQIDLALCGFASTVPQKRNRLSRL